MKELKVFTAKDFIEGKCSYEDYYDQFVTKGVTELVSRHIKEERITASTEHSFNDIPLREWDALKDNVNPLVGNKFYEVNSCGLALGDCVCIAKRAAELIRENYRQENSDDKKCSQS